MKSITLWCNQCGLYVRASKLYGSNNKIAHKSKLLKGLYLCPLCGKLIKAIRL